MKKSILMALFGVFTLFAVSCDKDDTQSFKEQVSGNYVSVNVKNGSTDVTSILRFEISLNDNNDYTLDIISINPLTSSETRTTETGDWSVNESQREITLTPDNGNSRVYDVTEVNDEQMRVTTVENGEQVIILFDRR